MLSVILIHFVFKYYDHCCFNNSKLKDLLNSNVSKLRPFFL